MRFEKWQALGNDYVVIEREQLACELTPARIRRICASHSGVGCDGILLMERAEGGTIAATLEIYNPDGSRAELSGNGARQAILYARAHGWSDLERVRLQTDAGVIAAEITGRHTCRVDMGRATTASKDFPSGGPDGIGELGLHSIGELGLHSIGELGLHSIGELGLHSVGELGLHSVGELRGEGPKGEPGDSADAIAGERETVRFQHVSIGNPQCAIALADAASLAALDLSKIGPPIKASALFPNRTNVSWHAELTPARADEPARIKARIFERGVGETLSSGTGATGAAIAYLLRTQRDALSWPAVVVVLDGGELTVEVDRDSLQVHLSGWAVPVFAGAFSAEMVNELDKTQ